MLFLPPANVVFEGYVFTGVCLSTGGGVLHPGGGSPSRGGSPSQGGFSIRGGSPSGGLSIRSMCGQYASYWNAFLFNILIRIRICGGFIWP